MAPVVTPKTNLTTTRYAIRVTGVVQGVGFRPFVYNLAQALALDGFVGNDSQGVFIEVQGDAKRVAMFVEALSNDAPPLAHIDQIILTECDAQTPSDFHIIQSQSQSPIATFVSPDMSICDECLAEFNDPTGRRYQYPFINCTHCGPRLTIIQDLPYDRPYTTMSSFVMCERCRQEYEDPCNRRFHAQPIACPDCGPQIWAENFVGEICEDPVAFIKAAIKGGAIVAIKGLGGFHLACDATNREAIATLRGRKHRHHKPLAVMMRDLEMVEQYAEIDTKEAGLLASPAHPIVLLRARNSLPDDIAPNTPLVGVMLPYTPLHHLVLDDRPLVMTSANISGQPIVKDNDEARATLGDIVDYFLMHNRPIETPCDDSVVRVIAGNMQPIRRSRGYAPFPVKLPMSVGPIVAVGGELKATFALGQGNHAILSQHIGDMANLETLTAFQKMLDHYLRLFQAKPCTVACDMHPGYLSTKWAQDFVERHQLSLIKVQHHHAHIAAVMAENAIPPNEAVIGFCFDGTGYGSDGTIWGGEVLRATYSDFDRLAYLKPTPLPGGDNAIQRPYRMALAHLWSNGLAWQPQLAPFQAASQQELRVLNQQLERNLNCTLTSSMGRLFDAVSSLIGVCQHVTYEGQAAVELESVADNCLTDRYEFTLQPIDNALVYDPAPVFRAILADLAQNSPQSIISARFHNTIAHLVIHLSQQLRASTGINTIALSGGVFQNTRLLMSILDGLKRHGFRAIHHRQVPPNDGGLALGQLMVAAACTQQKL